MEPRAFALKTSVAELVEGRRSIRKYQPDSISREEVQDLVRLAGRAPSAWNLQPWRVIAVSAPATKALLQQAAFNQPQVGGAPVVLVVYSDMDATLGNLEEVLPSNVSEAAREKLAARIRAHFAARSPAEIAMWGTAQSGIFLGYLMLVIEAFGYASSPMLGFRQEEVKQLFGLAANASVAALVAIGKPAESGNDSGRRPLETVLRWT